MQIIDVLPQMLMGIGHAIAWFFGNDEISRWTALVIWIGVTAMLTIPAFRRLFGSPLYADDLLFAAWLLTINRVCYSAQALVHNDTFADITRWTGIGAALFYGYVVSSYIRWPDRMCSAARSSVCWLEAFSRRVRRG